MLLKDLSISYLQETPLFERFKSVMSQLEKAEEIAYIMSNKDEGEGLRAIKIGTTLTLAVIEKITLGKNPKDFSQEDWRDIAGKVVDTAILLDAQSYTEHVFILYANYIDVSIRVNRDIISSKHAEEISALSEELKNLTKELQNGGLKEVDYVDGCLWISFEAMVKLLSSYSTAKLGSELGNIVIYSADYAIQYARLGMYSQEKVLIEEYLNHQGELDIELQKKYDKYLSRLEEKAGKMDSLIKDAFVSDFRIRLRGSVELARNVGVPEDRILDSIKKVDDYFG